MSIIIFMLLLNVPLICCGAAAEEKKHTFIGGPPTAEILNRKPFLIDHATGCVVEPKDGHTWTDALARAAALVQVPASEAPVSPDLPNEVKQLTRDPATLAPMPPKMPIAEYCRLHQERWICSIRNRTHAPSDMPDNQQ